MDAESQSVPHEPRSDVELVGNGGRKTGCVREATKPHAAELGDTIGMACSTFKN